VARNLQLCGWYCQDDGGLSDRLSKFVETYASEPEHWRSHRELKNAWALHLLTVQVRKEAIEGKCCRYVFRIHVHRCVLAFIFHQIDSVEGMGS
jgi:hypothetical protein